MFCMKILYYILSTQLVQLSGATFLESSGVSYGQSVEGIGLSFVQRWWTIYNKYSNRLPVT